MATFFIKLTGTTRARKKWRALLDNTSSVALFRITLKAFEELLGAFAPLALERAMQSASSPVAEPRARRRAYAPPLQLALALRFLCASDNLTAHALWTRRVVATVSRHVRFSVNLLLEVLQAMPDARVVYPDPSELPQLAALMHRMMPASARATSNLTVGALDGVFVPVSHPSPGDKADMYSQYMYKGGFGVIVVLGNGLICDYIANVDGCAGDRYAFTAHLDASTSNLNERLVHGIGRHGYFVVGDSAFGRCDTVVRNMTEPELRKLFDEFGAAEYETVRHELRVIHEVQRTSEWAVGSLKRVWKRLATALPTEEHAWRAVLLECAIHLNNYRVRRDGIGMVTMAVLNRVAKNEGLN